jgi:hypothetical protein
MKQQCSVVSNTLLSATHSPEELSMGQTFSLDLPPDLAQRAAAVAQQTQRRVEDVLLEWLGRGASAVPIESLPDEQVLALANREMSTSEQRELSALLARQREGALDEAARRRLDELMASYRHGMVEKAQALKVAVERGLRPPLDAHA